MSSSRLALAALALAVGAACAEDRPAPTAPDALLSVGSTTPGVRVHQLRTEEDPSVTGGAAFCAGAPFTANVVLNASAWSTQARAVDGAVVNEDVQRVGTALACAQITSFAFPPGRQENFYARFDLPEGSVTALGTCTIISNDVPTAGLVLAGCNLRVTDAPAGVAGGAATSLSVFNPFRVPGFETGSYWTLQLYEDGAGS